jgi:hypothetical protein
MKNKKTINKKAINPDGLMDVHRPTPKTEGGRYTEDNHELLDPVDHMKHHGIYREREEKFNKLKTLIDGREHLLKTKNGCENRILAMKRNVDCLDPIIAEFLAEQAKSLKKQMDIHDRRITKHLKDMKLPIIDAALSVRGIGAITVAYILSYVDIEKARYASSMWAYVGYDKSSDERYNKGEAGGGNQNLRTRLFATAGSIIKSTGTENPSPYAEVYVNCKRDLSVSNKITKTRLTNKKGMHEMAWKDVQPSHRHGAAIRKMMKHYLADFWYVWRTVEGLETPMLYPEAKLGHKGIVVPEERGWTYNTPTKKQITELKSFRKYKAKLQLKDEEVKEKKTSKNNK